MLLNLVAVRQVGPAPLGLGTRVVFVGGSRGTSPSLDLGNGKGRGGKGKGGETTCLTSPPPTGF